MELFLTIVFFLMVLSVWGAAHYYIGKRFVLPLSHKARWARAIWGVVWVHFVLAPLGLLARATLVGTWGYDALQWAVYVGMGAFTLIFFLIVIRDIIWWGASRVIDSREENHAPPENDLAQVDASRRAFMANSLNVGAISLAMVGAKAGMRNALKVPAVREVSVPFEKLPDDLDGFLIVQLSDIHVGPTIKREFFKSVVDVVNELQADAVVVTGDLIDGYVEHLWDDVEPITHLRSRHGTFFATGNHEYYWNAQAWCDKLQAEGIVVLNNAHQLIQHGKGRLLMAGCTDYSAWRHLKDHESDPQKAISDAPAHDLSILLAHQPKSIFAASDAGFDLQLSGHTHGGQFWPWNFVVGLVHPFSTGLGTYDKTKIYVSRGTGYWGPPMRLGAPSEITAIRLVKG